MKAKTEKLPVHNKLGFENILIPPLTKTEPHVWSYFPDYSVARNEERTMIHVQEAAEKKKRVRELMKRLGLTAIHLKKQSNFSWLTCGGLNLVGIATER
jgi:hypothetical protein